MKTKSIIAGMFLTTVAMAQIPPYVPANGLVAWYPLNGSANDLSGAANHGTIVAAAATADRYSNSGSACYFYGNSEIDCGSKPAFNLNDCSFSAWVNVSKTTPQFQCILSKFDSMPGSYAFGLFGNKLGVEYTYGSTNVKTLVGSGILSQYTWYHVVATHDVIEGIKLYVNGALYTSDWFSFNVLPGADKFRIGSQGPAFPLPMRAGRLDDIGVWNRALTQAEVSSLYFGCVITINTSPKSQSFNLGNTALFTCSTSAQGATYQWQIKTGTGFQNINNSAQYSGVTSDTLRISDLTLSNNQEQYRCAITFNGCTKASFIAQLTVNNDVGIAGPLMQNHLSIFPNPTQSDLHVIADADLMGSRFEIADQLGRVIITGTLDLAETQVELENLEKGIYFFSLDGKAKSTIKFLKE